MVEGISAVINVEFPVFAKCSWCINGNFVIFVDET